MGSSFSFVVSRRPSRKAASTSRAAPAAPAVTTKETAKGTAVTVASNDAQIRELALQRIQKEKELEQERIIRESRRKSATTAADLQRRALQLDVEKRDVNVSRELARLNRESRVSRARVFSSAATANVTRGSAFKASQIAARSQLTGETGKVTSDEARNKLLDQIRSEEIEANFQSRLAENPDPVNVFLDENITKTVASTDVNKLIKINAGIGSTYYNPK